MDEYTMTADDAALYDERDDALLRAERAEMREEAQDQRIEELEDEIVRLLEAKGVAVRIASEAAHAEAMEVVAEKDAEIAQLRKYVAGVKSAEAMIAKAERDAIADYLDRESRQYRGQLARHLTAKAILVRSGTATLLGRKGESSAEEMDAALGRVRGLIAKAEEGEGIVIYPGHSTFHTVDTGLLRDAIGDDQR